MKALLQVLKENESSKKEWLEKLKKIVDEGPLNERRKNNLKSIIDQHMDDLDLLEVSKCIRHETSMILDMYNAKEEEIKYCFYLNELV